MKKFLIFIFCFGCGLQEAHIPSNNVGLGALGGVAASKAAEKIQKVFTPEYPLYLQYLEICTIEKQVTCYVIPCENNCVYKTSLDSFIANNPKVVTLRSSAQWINAAHVFCSKNKDACIDQLAKYAGKTIILEVRE